MKILKKEWFIWKFWKKRGVVEKMGEEETKSMPHAPVILIAKYLFTGSLKNRWIDNLETQKKYISMKNSQFFNYLLYAKSK